MGNKQATPKKNEKNYEQSATPEAQLADAALHKAAKEGSGQLIRNLIAKGADVNTPDEDTSLTPLCQAASWGNIEAIKVLLDYNALVDLPDSVDRTPLHWAATSANTTPVQMLLAAGADIDSVDTSGATPLHKATLDNETAVSMLLIQEGADINVGNIYSRTPLHNAATRGDAKTIEALLDAGADASVNDGHNARTPLHFAAKYGRAEAVRVLVPETPNLQHKDLAGLTPLATMIENDMLYWKDVGIGEKQIIRELLAGKRSKK
eukprot:GILI01011398.1.p1 GENE.GILI01011398.1~~GILI01011398.1.p1  ORF type:complete len:275 (+),score=56.82 GILI01011398.1:34-825(+)